MTVKRLLAADNPDYPAVKLNGDEELIVWGVVTHSIHRVR